MSDGDLGVVEVLAIGLFASLFIAAMTVAGVAYAHAVVWLWGWMA